MSERLSLGFVFLVTVISFLVFPLSNLTGVSYLFIGWMALIFAMFFVIGTCILGAKAIIAIERSPKFNKNKIRKEI